jgi:Rod binding domain-containing protein
MNSISVTTAQQAAKSEAATKTADPKSVKVAREFEAIMLRQMLSCLERTTGAGSKGPMTGGGSIQTSMMVNVLADAMAAAGGIGLGAVILQSQQAAASAGRLPESRPGKEVPQGT